jgi:hypothetical protein
MFHRELVGNLIQAVCILEDLPGPGESGEILVEARIAILEHELPQAALGIGRQLDALVLRQVDERGQPKTPV